FVLAASMFFSGGTEAPLLLLCASLFLMALAELDRRMRTDEDRLYHYLALAVLSVLVCLARADAFLFVAACAGAIALSRLTTRRQHSMALIACSILPAMLVIFGSVIANLAETGHEIT